MPCLCPLSGLAWRARVLAGFRRSSLGANMARLALMLKGQHMPISEMVELAQRAENAGYESVWVPEFWRECFVPAAAVALGTSRIKIGSGIALAYARSPALLAQTVANIDEVAE